MQPKSRLTFCVLTDYMESEYNTKALNGILDFAMEHDLNLITFVGGNLESPNGRERNRNILFELPDKRIADGIIVISPLIGQYVGRNRFMDFLKRYRDVPIVTINEWMEGRTAVLIDNEPGMREMVSHLIDAHGRRDFAILRGPKGIPDAEERFNACISVCKEHGIRIGADHILETQFGITFGMMAVDELLDVRKIAFDAIIAPNDHTALGAMKALQLRGIAVPQSVAIVGFDDISESRYCSPKLTTVSQPVYDLGKAAARLLFDTVTGAETRPVISTFKTKLTLRESCGCNRQDQASAPENAAPPAEEPFESLFQRQRNLILSNMINPLIDINPSKKAAFFKHVEIIIDSVSRALTTLKPGVFLQSWKEAVSTLIINGYSEPNLNSLLSTLRKDVIACVSEYAMLSVAENMFFTAMEMNGAELSGDKVSRHIMNFSQEMNLNAFFSSLDSAVNLEQQLDLMNSSVPSLNLGSFAFVLYGSEQGDGEAHKPGTTRLYLKVSGNECLFYDKGGGEFPITEVIPEGILTGISPFRLVVEALFWGDDQIGFIAIGLKSLEDNNSENFRARLSSALRNTLLLSRIKALTEKGESQTADSHGDMRIRKAIHYISNNYNTDLSLEEIAQNVHMNPDYFSSFFKQKTGTGFLEYLTSFRVEKALKLLENTELTIKEVAGMVGYKDSNYFGKIIRKYTNLLPTEYRGKILGIKNTRTP